MSLHVFAGVLLGTYAIGYLLQRRGRECYMRAALFACVATWTTEMIVRCLK